MVLTGLRRQRSLGRHGAAGIAGDHVLELGWKRSGFGWLCCMVMTLVGWTLVSRLALEWLERFCGGIPPVPCCGTAGAQWSNGALDNLVTRRFPVLWDTRTYVQLWIARPTFECSKRWSAASRNWPGGLAAQDRDGPAGWRAPRAVETGVARTRARAPGIQALRGPGRRMPQQEVVGKRGEQPGLGRRPAAGSHWPRRLP